MRSIVVNDGGRIETMSFLTVFMIQKGKTRSFWTRIGVAFRNKDNSLNVKLDAIPASGQLHIRESQKGEDLTKTAGPVAVVGSRKDVFMVQKGKTRSFWTRIGVAFVNKDGSLNVKLDAFPVSGQLHIRDRKAGVAIGAGSSLAATTMVTCEPAPVVMRGPINYKTLQDCPECGAPLAHAGGCVNCYSCGWAVCG